VNMIWYWVNRYVFYHLPPLWHTNVVFLINCIRLRKPFYWQRIDNPRTFTEKLNWLKLYGMRPEYARLADKYEVRDFVKNRIGDTYLVPLKGVYPTAQEIPWDDLPTPVVLKATHGSGMNIFVRNRDQQDVKLVRRQFNRWFAINPYYLSREWQYRKIRPRILAEELLGDNVPDYKFFCFRGRVRYIQLDVDRFVNHKRNLYTRDWELLAGAYNYPKSSQVYTAPEQLQEMIGLAERLAEGFEFLRVDFLIAGSLIYFGELTFFPGGGAEPFDSFEFDYEFAKEWNPVVHQNTDVPVR